MKKKICLLLVVLVFSISSVSVFAGEIEGQAVIQPQYEIINSIAAGLTIGSDGKSVSSAKLMTTISGSDCYLTVDLQQKSGSQWKTIKTWTASKLNGVIVTLEKDYYVVHGSYRVKATGTVENSSLNVQETAEIYSREVVY